MGADCAFSSLSLTGEIFRSEVISKTRSVPPVLGSVSVEPSFGAGSFFTCGSRTILSSIADIIASSEDL